jgi:GT2 family glycosyltransferase
MTPVATYPLIHIVVLTWNQCSDTVECLDSVFRMTYPNYRVIVVDNASEDDTASVVKTRFPRICYLTNEINRGFAAAVNRGISYALEQHAAYVFLLNNDTIVDPALLDHLMSYSATDRVGALVPKIYYYRQPNLIWSVGARLNKWTLDKHGDARDRLDHGEWETVIEREYVTACAILLSRPLLDQIGLLDERFFYYYDDADLSLRIHAAGFRILLVPQAKLWHKVAKASGGINTPYERYWMGRSSVLFFRKHTHGWHWLIVLPYRLGSALKTVVGLLGQNKRESAKAYLHGLWDGLMLEGSDLGLRYRSSF